jgi:hypothetical protein
MGNGGKMVASSELLISLMIRSRPRQGSGDHGFGFTLQF